MKKLLVGLCCLIFAGCALIEERPLAVGTAVQIGTIRLIQAAEDPAARAERIVEITETVIGSLDGDALTTVAEVGDLARSLIDYSALGVYEQILLDSLITAVQARLLEEIGSGRLSEQDALRVRQMLDWARQAATVYRDA